MSSIDRGCCEFLESTASNCASKLHIRLSSQLKRKPKEINQSTYVEQFFYVFQIENSPVLEKKMIHQHPCSILSTTIIVKHQSNLSNSICICFFPPRSMITFVRTRNANIEDESMTFWSLFSVMIVNSTQVEGHSHMRTIEIQYTHQ